MNKNKITKTISKNTFLSNRLLLSIITVLVFVPSAVFSAERLAVKVGVANIRSGPGTTHNVLWQVEKYHPLNIIKKTGDWYQFTDFEGDRGWIHKSMLGKISTVITKKNCNIRKGPGTTHEIAFTAEKGIPLKVIKTQKQWLHIEYADGDRGWIFKPLVW